MSISQLEVSHFEVLYSRIERQVWDLKENVDFCEDDDLLVNYNKLHRFSQDINNIRFKIYKNDTLVSFNEKLHCTGRDIQNIIQDIELRINKLYKEEIIIVENQKQQRRKELGDSDKNKDNDKDNDNDVIEIMNSKTNKYEDESIETLRSRLLSTKYDQLDQFETTEIQNNYHDSIQKELIDSLPTMVSSLKDQALQFQEMIKNDAVILKEATQNFENSSGKFNNVNDLLSKYHKEGKLGFWFYLRVIGIVFVSFLFLLIIIRLIPARH